MSNGGDALSPFPWRITQARWLRLLHEHIDPDGNAGFHQRLIKLCRQVVTKRGFNFDDEWQRLSLWMLRHPYQVHMWAGESDPYVLKVIGNKLADEFRRERGRPRRKVSEVPIEAEDLAWLGDSGALQGGPSGSVGIARMPSYRPDVKSCIADNNPQPVFTPAEMAGFNAVSDYELELLLRYHDDKEPVASIARSESMSEAAMYKRLQRARERMQNAYYSVSQPLSKIAA